MLTKLTTYKGHVPQGAPTSTYIANLVFTKTGNELAQLAKEYNITFTSFVDDLTFSSCCDFHFLVPTIIDIITRNGFIISHQKTFYQSHCPSITGADSLAAGAKQVDEGVGQLTQSLSDMPETMRKANSIGSGTFAKTVNAIPMA